MKHLSIRQINRIILEELSNDPFTSDELEAREDTWSGGDNLALSIDHSKSVGGEAVTPSPETLDITGDKGVFRMAESKLREILRNSIIDSRFSHRF